MKRTIVALGAALLITGLAALAAGGTATAGSGTAQRTAIVPREGHYEGRDLHQNHIRFYYTVRGHMENFRVNHTVIGGAPVSGAQWQHTCHPNNLCTRGTWVNGRPAGQHVRGYWSHVGGEHAISWYAHWVPFYGDGNHGLF